MKKLPLSFYLDEDVVGVARALLGKVLVTHFNGSTTSGIITETEAYNGIIDRRRMPSVGAAPHGTR